MSGVTLGIDFGERRIGVALSDPERRHAVPLTVVVRASDGQAILELLRLADEHQARSFVVGDPRLLDGSRGDASRRARSFARKLKKESGLPVELVDEALSTVAATERLREAGLDGKALRDRVDAVAAQILLQDALDRASTSDEVPAS